MQPKNYILLLIGYPPPPRTGGGHKNSVECDRKNAQTIEKLCSCLLLIGYLPPDFAAGLPEAMQREESGLGGSGARVMGRRDFGDRDPNGEQNKRMESTLFASPYMIISTSAALQWQQPH